jgi:hypothetical protein
MSRKIRQSPGQTSRLRQDHLDSRKSHRLRGVIVKSAFQESTEYADGQSPRVVLRPESESVLVTSDASVK